MLSPLNKVAFLIFALVTVSFGLHGFLRLYRRVRRGSDDTELRWNDLARRIVYATTTTLLQNRTFRKRPWVSFFHAFIFYGFVYYLVVNLIDGLEGFYRVGISSTTVPGKIFNLTADVLSALVLLGVVALVMRRFLLPSRRDFTFNDRTLLHESLDRSFVTRDSIVVSVFILFHVGSRALGAGANLAAEGPDRYQPFATLISHLIPASHANSFRIFGYWGALGSVLAFLSYFPRTKHIHIFMAPFKYLVARDESSGVLPAMKLDVEANEPKLGARLLEDLAWPRLIDAYACIQCNRCQDVCPAPATGKSLSPSALEINKRMELNQLARTNRAFEAGKPSPNPLLSFALSPEAAWACTTCGACMQACPVQDEPMLDIIDVRRQQVMMEGEFPAQLQTAFRGMERSQNPWGINHAKRLDWADGLNVKTTDDNPEPQVLFWVGCAASYDPQSQKTARAFVQLLQHANVDFAVLGKRECCTGDTARRAGNEYLYRQLAETNVATLNEVKPKLIVASCPHCMNTVGKEYKQLGGDYKVIHHTEYLQRLVDDGLIETESGNATVAYHDPCYLGRHNGVYDAPRNLLNILNNSVVELDRTRENSFCCGAGGAQFWKEEEAGSQRISDNRYLEVKARLDGAAEKVLAVGCPFCKSMLQSTPAKGDDDIVVKDVAELLWEGVQRKSARQLPATKVEVIVPSDTPSMAEQSRQPQPGVLDVSASSGSIMSTTPLSTESVSPEPTPVVRRKWSPKPAPLPPIESLIVPAKTASEGEMLAPPSEPRKKWTKRVAVGNPEVESSPSPVLSTGSAEVGIPAPPNTNPPLDDMLTDMTNTEGAPAIRRKVWKPQK